MLFCFFDYKPTTPPSLTKLKASRLYLAFVFLKNFYKMEEYLFLHSEHQIMKTAFVFPGQGSQNIGMGKEFFDTFKTARHIIEEGSDYLNVNLKKIMFDGPVETLKQTNIAQVALYAVSVAVLEILPPVDVSFFAGHSSGEYASLFGAKAFSFHDGLALVSKRANLMHQASDDSCAMSSVIGASIEDVRSHLYGSSVIACDNAPGQIVISGAKKDLCVTEKNLEHCAKRVIPLSVSGAFHSPFMQKAQNEFMTCLKSYSFSPLQGKVFSNVTADLYQDEDIPHLLSQQIVRPVRWREIVLHMKKLGVERIIELGTGTTLTGLNRRICPDMLSFSIHDMKSYKNFEAVL